MSAGLLGDAFGAEMPSHVAKLILLKLVDAAEEDGTRIYPAVATIARAAQCSRRHVQRTLRAFEEVHLLKQVSAGGSGPGDTAEYHLDVGLLHRIRRDGWAAATGQDPAPLQNGGTEGEAPEKGDTMSPIPERATSATPKGDISDQKGRHDVSPNPSRPLQDPSEGERESAGAREGQGEQTGDGLTDDERKALHRRFRALAARYPGSHLDPLARSEPIWQAMPEEKRKRAEAMLPAFVAALKGSRRRPPLHEYLGEDKFDLIDEAKPKDTGGMVALAPFSRDFWLVFHKRAAEGQRRVGMMVDQAKRGIAFGVDRSEAPVEAQISACWRVDVGSAEWQAWVDHWAGKGVLMPRPNAATFAWMPSRWPPAKEQQRIGLTSEEIDEAIG